MTNTLKNQIYEIRNTAHINMLDIATVEAVAELRGFFDLCDYLSSEERLNEYKDYIIYGETKDSIDDYLTEDHFKADEKTLIQQGEVIDSGLLSGSDEEVFSVAPSLDVLENLPENEDNRIERALASLMADVRALPEVYGRPYVKEIEWALKKQIPLQALGSTKDVRCTCGKAMLRSAFGGYCTYCGQALEASPKPAKNPRIKRSKKNV